MEAPAPTTELLKKPSSQNVGEASASFSVLGAATVTELHGVGTSVTKIAEEPTSAAINTMDTRVDPGGENRNELVDFDGLTLSGCGVKIFQFILEVCILRSQSTGKKNSKAVFPLPTSRVHLLGAFPGLASALLDWLMCVVVSLNSYWGCEIFSDQPPNEIQLRCLHGLVRDVDRFCGIPATVPSTCWKDFFKVKGIDYKGDEVQVARRFSWANIKPALPGEVGSVPLSDVCTLGCHHYVNRFEQYLKPKPEWAQLTWPRVMVDDADWGDVCRGLVESGVCVFIKEEDVFDTGRGRLLNGMFGVTKEEFTPEGTEIFRLIMNLVPLNGMCSPITGDVDTLPAWSSMNPYFLQPYENLIVSSEDVKCFFYTMALPEAWVKFLAFNKEVPAEVVPSDMAGGKVYVASRVLPMGFLNSVSLAQHVHRNLVSWSLGEDGHVNAPEAELRKDRPFSVHASNWRIYLDNYDLLEKVVATRMVQTQESCPDGVISLRAAYVQACFTGNS